MVAGFNSQIFLAPDDGVGVVAFTNGARNTFAATWLMGETESLLGDLIGATRGGIRADIPQHPEIWGDLCGWHRPRAQRTDLQAWSMVGAGVQVLVRRGQLVLRTLSPIPALWRGLRLRPGDKDDPYVFLIDLSPYGIDTVRVVFSRDDAGATTGVHLDGILLSAEKLTASSNPRLWATSVAGALAVATAVRAVRRARSKPYKEVETWTLRPPISGA